MASRAAEIVRKGHFAMLELFFFFCVCKKFVPLPLEPLQIIHTPTRKPCQKSYPPTPGEGEGQILNSPLDMKK